MKLKMVAWPPSVVACWERSERTLPFLGGSTSSSVYDSAIRLISLLLSAAAATFARMMSVPEPQEGACQDKMISDLASKRLVCMAALSHEWRIPNGKLHEN